MGYGFNDSYRRICNDLDNEEYPVTKSSATLVRNGRLRQWGWGWFNAKKVSVCRGFVMDDPDRLMLGCSRKIRRRHHFFSKLKTELGRMMIRSRPSSNVIFTYDALSYSLNFDDGSYKYADPQALRLSCKIAEVPVPAERGHGYY